MRKAKETEPLPSKDEAALLFRQLIKQYGLQWTAATVPEAAWEQMRCVTKVLNVNERREALGWRRN